jgi:predicted porin
MKPTTLALAAAAAFLSSTVHAQSNVQVYGLIDAGVEYVNHAAANGDGLTRVISGGKNTSRWGFRGTEDLGGGLKAVWNLEGGILMDTGAIDGQLFRRQAYVGLDGAFGRVVIGRSFTTVYDFVIKYDPLGFAPNYSWATTGSATGPSKYGMTTGFDNLIKYSGTTGGFTYGATIAMGEVAGNSNDGRKYAAAGAYNTGGLGVMLAWEQINGTTVVATGNRDKTTAFHAAADYKMDDWRFQAGMRGYKLRAGRANAAELQGDTYWGGITYLVKPAVTLTAAVYHINTKNLASAVDADPTLYVLRGMYALSKRTDLYLTGGYARADHGQLVGLSRDDPGFRDTQAGITAGIQHRF